MNNSISFDPSEVSILLPGPGLGLPGPGLNGLAQTSQSLGQAFPGPGYGLYWPGSSIPGPKSCLLGLALDPLPGLRPGRGRMYGQRRRKFPICEYIDHQPLWRAAQKVKGYPLFTLVFSKFPKRCRKNNAEQIIKKIV